MFYSNKERRRCQDACPINRFYVNHRLLENSIQFLIIINISFSAGRTQFIAALRWGSRAHAIVSLSCYGNTILLYRPFVTLWILLTGSFRMSARLVKTIDGMWKLYYATCPPKVQMTVSFSGSKSWKVRWIWNIYAVCLCWHVYLAFGHFLRTGW